MPTVATPYIIPNSIEFNIGHESSLTQTVFIYNPYAYDILFKVDNAQPQKYSLSDRQGLISSRQKLPLEVTCRLCDLSKEDKIQVRFFKWSRLRHGQKPRPQQYLGFRELNLCVTDGHSHRERMPSQTSDRLSASIPISTHRDSSTSHPKPGSIVTSQGSNQAYQDSGFGDASQYNYHHHHNGQRFQVASNIILAIILLLMGLLINKVNEDWFLIHVMDGIKPQTLSIVAYTLAGVVILRLLTFR